jgi:hypothetical protein
MVTRGTSLFVASSWRGPYRMLNPSIMACEYDDHEVGGCRTEDPFLWYSTSPLTHAKSTPCAPGSCVVLISNTPLNWRRWCQLSGALVSVERGVRDLLRQSERGFHLLMHDHEPFAYHKQVLTYGYTEDRSAVHGWVFSYVEAANGTAIAFAVSDTVSAPAQLTTEAPRPTDNKNAPLN